MKRIITTAALTLTLGLTACSAPAPTTETEPAPSFTEGTYQGTTPGEITEADREYAYLDTVREMSYDPATASLPDAELLAMGRPVCADVEAGVTFDQFVFPGINEWDSAIIAGAAVGVWCPELTEQGMGGELS